MTSGSSIGFTVEDTDINDINRYYEKSTSRDRANEKLQRPKTKERRANFAIKTKSLHQPNRQDASESIGNS